MVLWNNDKHMFVIKFSHVISSPCVKKIKSEHKMSVCVKKNLVFCENATRLHSNQTVLHVDAWNLRHRKKIIKLSRQKIKTTVRVNTD